MYLYITFNMNGNDNIMDKLVDHHILTEDGKCWLTRALDPFHDYELEKVGFPDHVGTSSIVFEVQRNVTISKPASLAAGAWDCHVVQTPLALAVPDVTGYDYSAGTSGSVGPQFTGILDRTTANTFHFGGLMADCVPTGTGTFQQNITNADRRISLDSGDVLFAATTSNSSTVRARLVASAFEVENTTAPLYRQGAVTVYNTPSFKADRLVRGADSTATAVRQGHTMVASFAAPPRSEARAKAFIGSRTWHAEDGCYVPSRFNTLDNKPQEFAGLVWLATDQDGQGVLSPTLGPAALDATVIAGTTVAASCGNQYPNIIMPVDNAGAYFTGLSDQTVLTLMIRQTWEIFPAADMSLMRLAKPSPLYDPKALEAYSHIIRELPLGTIRANNDAGKWFRMIGKIARQALPYAFAAGNAVLGASPLGMPIKIAGSQLLRALEDNSRKQASKPARKALPPVPQQRKKVPRDGFGSASRTG